MKLEISSKLVMSGNDFIYFLTLHDHHSMVYHKINYFLLFTTNLYLKKYISHSALTDYCRIIRKGYLDRFINDKFHGASDLNSKIRNLVKKHKVNLDSFDFDFVEIYHELKQRNIIDIYNYASNLCDYIIDVYDIWRYFLKVINLGKFLSSQTLDILQTHLEKFVEIECVNYKYRHEDYHETINFESFIEDLKKSGFISDIVKIIKNK